MTKFLLFVFTIFIVILPLIVIAIPIEGSGDNSLEIYEDDCVRVSNMIDISKIYQNVIFPNLVDIGLCSGSCNVIKKTILNGTEVFETSTKKCVPTSIKFLQIFLFDSETNKMVPFEVHELVVNQCGCKL